MTLPRTAAEVLSDHVVFQIRCIDRMLLSFPQPGVQYGSGIHGFFCRHRGNRFVSSALMHPMTELHRRHPPLDRLAGPGPGPLHP